MDGLTGRRGSVWRGKQATGRGSWKNWLLYPRPTENMLAAFSDKLTQMESVLKEHGRALAELQTLLQTDAATAADQSIATRDGSAKVVQRLENSPTRHGTRLTAVRRVLTEMQKKADQTDAQLGKLAHKLERHDVEIAELRCKMIWTHAELPAAAPASSQHRDRSSPNVPRTPLPGTLPVDVTRYVMYSSPTGWSRKPGAAAFRCLRRLNGFE